MCLVVFLELVILFLKKNWEGVYILKCIVIDQCFFKFAFEREILDDKWGDPHGSSPPRLKRESTKLWSPLFHRENGGTLGMVP